MAPWMARDGPTCETGADRWRVVRTAAGGPGFCTKERSASGPGPLNGEVRALFYGRGAAREAFGWDAVAVERQELVGAKLAQGESRGLTKIEPRRYNGRYNNGLTTHKDGSANSKRGRKQWLRGSVELVTASAS
jgi:hypothetical protein